MKELRALPIRTERLTLRPYAEEDAPFMFANWATDPEVTRFLTWQVHRREEDSLAYIRHCLSAGECAWCIVPDAEGEPEGAISVVDVDPENDACELGWCLSRHCWGKGYMPEAVRAIVAFLFDVVSANRVAADHDLENQKSGRVMQKAGMTFEGVRRQGFRGMRGIQDMACYSILASDPRAADS